MPPSRGSICSACLLRLGRRPFGNIQEPRLQGLRKFSSSTQWNNRTASLRVDSSQPLLLRPRYRPGCASKVSSLLLPTLTARYQSTVKDAAAQAVEALPQRAAETIPSTIDEFTSLATTDLTNMPEQIGYLKALGLEYGLGPTSLVEWLLEHIHIWTATPWWASIVLTAAVIRLAIFPLTIKASDTGARLGALKDVLAPHMQKIKDLAAQGRREESVLAQQELKQIYRDTGIKTREAFIPLVLQTVIGFGTFKLMRGMANLPVPGLEDGGFLWISNLAVPDPYFVVPAAVSLTMHYILKLGGETGTTANMSPGMLNFMLYWMPGISFMITAFLPGCLQLSFATATGIGIIQARILRDPDFRQWVGIAPLPVTKPTVVEKPKIKLAHAYQAPGPEKKAPPKPDDLVGGAVHEVKRTVSDVQEFIATKISEGRVSLAKRRTDDRKERGRSYELKRRREIDDKRRNRY